MASAEYIAAAKQANRQPTTYMSVEDASSDTLYYTTQEQWEDVDAVNTRVNTVYEPGSITQDAEGQVLTYSGGSVNSDALVFREIGQFTNPYESFVFFMSGSFAWPYSLGNSVLLRFRFRDTLTSPTIDFYSDSFQITGPFNDVNETIYYTIFSEDLDIGSNGEAFALSDTVYITAEASAGAGVWTTAYMFAEADIIKPTSQFITAPLDFGSVLTTSPIFGVDDITRGGTTLTYSYSYSTDDISYVSGGSIVDGDAIASSRYYKFQIDFLTTTGGRAKVREIQLKEGIFRYYGSNIAEPFEGVSPQIVPKSVSSFTQKIQLDKGLSTTGEASVKLFWVPETADLIASGYLKGKDVVIYSGFVGLDTTSYEPVITGTWYDHDLDEVSGIITIKIRDAFKQFEKRKIPEEVVNTTTGEITTSASDTTWNSVGLVTVMKEGFDLIGLRARYISPLFDTLESGDYGAAKYKVSRVINKPKDFSKLLNELAITGSMYLIPLGNGQIKPKPFDINQEHIAILDANDIKFNNLKGNISEFYSRFYAYYNPIVTLTDDPDNDRDDYDNATALIDSNAELRWFPERGTKQHFDKWKVGRVDEGTALTSPPAALNDLVGLWNSLFTEPLYTVKAVDIPPRFADIEPADVVQVDNLRIPVVTDEWENLSLYTGDFKSFASETTTPVSIRFSPDKTKAFVLSSGDTTIYQYTLSDPGVMSSATYDSKSADLSSLGFPVKDLSFNPEGDICFVLTDGGDDVYSLFLTNPFDVSNISSTGSTTGKFPELTNARAFWFKPDGLKIYMLNEDTTSKVFQYSMSVAFDTGSATYDSVFFSVQSQDSAPVGLSFDVGGSNMYMVGATNDKIFQYKLDTAWSLSIVSLYGSNEVITTEDTTPQCMLVSNSGEVMQVLGGTTDSIYTYNLNDLNDITIKIYTEGDRVIRDGKMWRARQDNSGKDPISEATFWQDMEINAEGYTQGKHFFVLGRKFNPNTALIDLDLMEMPPGTLGAFSAAEFSSAFDI